MIPILICEDNKIQRKEIEKIIDNHVVIEGYGARIVLSTGKPEEILEFIIGNNIKKGIYFIDIDLGSQIDGLELAMEIRKNDIEGSIIFVTSHSELMNKTYLYKLEALEFIVKGSESDMKREIKESLDYIIARYRDNKNYNEEIFKIQEDDEIRFILISEILFIETTNTPHKLRLNGTNRQVEFRGNLSDIEKEYPALLRVHQSILVNPKNIDSVNRKTKIITMKNGQQTIASRRLLKSLLM